MKEILLVSVSCQWFLHVNFVAQDSFVKLHLFVAHLVRLDWHILLFRFALLELFKDPSSPVAILFCCQVRLYNNVFSFTSFAVRLDKKLASLQRGVYTFRAHGQIFHSLPPLIPNSDGPRYFQLYFWDNDNELENRMSVFLDAYVDRELMVLLIDVMKVNPYAQLLKWINQYSSIRNLRLHISKNILVDQRCYNSPSADQVAAIWIEGNDDANIPQSRDIVACRRDGQTHQIQHYYGYYDSLQYPFFFPYGDNGWQQNILKLFVEKMIRWFLVGVLLLHVANSWQQHFVNIVWWSIIAAICCRYVH
ncbi:uncharacterized protein [Primulina eburnea]|uniref:uncharacterized protein isoform X2 n=1 Tax=Primulina eburnea TaxID=1245227 RepID=UPI003C6C046E